MDMTLYDLFKLIHIGSAAIVVASLFIPALYWQHQSSDSLNQRARKALRIAWFITLPALMIQMITGFTIIGLQGYSMHAPWVMVTFAGFGLLILTWMLAIYSLAMRQLSRWRTCLVLCMCIITVMLYFMANR